MEEKLELIEYVYHDSSMGEYTTNYLLEKLKEKDNKIKGLLEDILKKYQEFKEESKIILENNKKYTSEPGLMSKIGSSMGITKEVIDDNSDSSIADMMIKGLSMGTLEMEKKLKQYKDDLEKEEKELSKKFLKFQEKSIDELKKYL